MHVEVEIIDYSAQCGNNVSSPHLCFIFCSCDPKMLAHAMPPLTFIFISLQLTYLIQFNYGARLHHLLFSFLYLFHFTSSFSQFQSMLSLVHYLRNNTTSFQPMWFSVFLSKARIYISISEMIKKNWKKDIEFC